jgi:hypothetical protein
MALSSYDLIAFDENGKQTNGILNGFIEGTSCEIYKNWIYVRDKNGWVAGREFQKPTIAEIFSGYVEMCRFSIDSTRGNQNSIFVNIKSTAYEPFRISRMLGIGSYSYQPPYKKVMLEEGLDSEKWKSMGLQYEVLKIPDDTKGKIDDIYIYTFENKEDGKQLSFNRSGDEYNWQYVGILPETFQEFINWLKDDDSNFYKDEEFFRLVDTIEKSNPLRFNQGDAYFAKALDFEVPTTLIGEQEEPILTQMCKGEETNGN